MKRAIDIVVSSLALVVLSPLLLVIVAAVVVTLGRPILFAQHRAGRYGVPFTIRKFRTMTHARDIHGNLLPDAERLTDFGRFLRSSSLDELPELLNVLRGEMSLVGPRPLPVHYLPRYSQRHARRHEVRPGITGLAQVNGRNLTTWSDRLDMDVWYVDNRSLILDLQLLLRTITSVISRKGVSAEGHATMPEFQG